MCTDTKMQYLATNVRQNLGFHHPRDIRAAFEWVWLIVMTWSSTHFWVGNVINFHILKRNIWKNCSIPPKFSAEWRPSKSQNRVKKGSKKAQKLAFFGNFYFKIHMSKPFNSGRCKGVNNRPIQGLWHPPPQYYRGDDASNAIDPDHQMDFDRTKISTPPISVSPDPQVRIISNEMPCRHAP